MFLFVLQFILSLFFYQGDCSFSCYLKALFFSVLQNKWLCHIIALQKQSKKTENKKKPFQESVHVFPHIPKQPPEVSFLKSILKTSQNSKGNTCLGLSFLIQLQVLHLQLQWKGDSGTNISCEYCEILKKTFFI